MPLTHRMETSLSHACLHSLSTLAQIRSVTVKTCVWVPFGTVGRARTREDAGSISGLVCARGYFKLLCLSLESNEVDLRSGAIRGETGKAPSSEDSLCPELGSRYGQTKPFPIACTCRCQPKSPHLQPIPMSLILPALDTHKELIPSSPQAAFYMLDSVYHILSHVVCFCQPCCLSPSPKQPGEEELNKN